MKLRRKVNGKICITKNKFFLTQKPVIGNANFTKKLVLSIDWDAERK